MVIQVGQEQDPAKRIRVRQGVMIRKTRMLRYLSIAEFAEQLNVHISAVSQWENGTTSPRQAKQIQIAKVLDVPHSMLFGLDAESVA